MRWIGLTLLLVAALTGGVARPDRARAQSIDVLNEVALCYNAAATWYEAAAGNGRTLQSLEWQPFGREYGWETYLPMTQQEIGTRCAPFTPGFAQALAAFQARYGLEADGRFGPATARAPGG